MLFLLSFWLLYDSDVGMFEDVPELILIFFYIHFSSCSDWLFFATLCSKSLIWFSASFYCCLPVNCSFFQLVYPLFLTGSFYAVELHTEFLEHPYNQCFEPCICQIAYLYFFSSFTGVLICYFIWAMFLCLLVLAASLCLFLCIR